MIEKRFCTYVHLRPDGTPFYVGKGTIARALWKKRRSNPHHQNIISKYGLKNIRVRILKRELTEVQAFDHERDAIECLRAFNYQLCNLTDGGDGASGYKASEKTRAKMRAIRKGRPGFPHTEETKLRLSALASAREHPAHTPAAKEKIRAAHIGRKFTAEHRAKLRIIASNRSPETRAKISASKAGKKFSESRLAIHRACHIGLKHSAETKAKMSAAKKLYWLKKKGKA